MMTWMRRPARYDLPVIETAALSPKYVNDNPAVAASGLCAHFNRLQRYRA